jgi:hypothetical protein
MLHLGSRKSHLLLVVGEISVEEIVGEEVYGTWE